MSETNNVYWKMPNICPAMNSRGGNMTEYRRDSTIINEIVDKNNVTNSVELKKLLNNYRNTNLDLSCTSVPHGEVILPEKINLP